MPLDCAIEGKTCHRLLVKSPPPPPHPPRDSYLEPGTTPTLADMDVPNIVVALMVILLLNVRYSQTQGTYAVNLHVRLFTDIAIVLHCCYGS